MKNTILSVFALLLSANAYASESTVLLQDGFSKLDRSTWNTEMLETASFTVNGTLNLRLSGAAATAYSNAAVFSKRPFLKNDFYIDVLSNVPAKGSRGWGYWNGSMDPAKSAIAWFIQLQGDEICPLNGFFAVIQEQGTAPEFLPLDPTLLQAAHRYGIRWKGKVQFLVDGLVVAEGSKNVTEPMEIHLWEDNAAYDPVTFGPMLFDFAEFSTLQFDNVLVVK